MVSITKGNPDGDWFGAEPVLLHERTGAAAASLIGSIHDAALSYPFAGESTMWHGQNRNSFTAWVGLEVPELGLSLPAKAIGKSWMIDEYGKYVSAE